MSAVFTKLNFKDHAAIVVLNAPPDFEAEIAALPSGVVVLRAAADAPASTFALAFVQTQTQIQETAHALAARAQGDALLWFAYPKGTSKRYTCDFNRDTGWDVLGTLGFEPVRQVAIDADWSALRFRRVEYIKKADALILHD
jgi:hypothetical protein